MKTILFFTTLLEFLIGEYIEWNNDSNTPIRYNTRVPQVVLLHPIRPSPRKEKSRPPLKAHEGRVVSN